MPTLHNKDTVKPFYLHVGIAFAITCQSVVYNEIIYVWSGE